MIAARGRRAAVGRTREGFEILTGKHPFEVARRLGIQALMRAQLTEHPSGLRTLNSEIPIELDEVILAYLNK